VYAGDEGFQAMWGEGRVALVAGQYAPMGTGTKVDGGLRVSGRYSWGSGIDHANWVLGACIVDGAALGFVLPIDDVDVLDNWYVAGLSGTSSTDYELNDAFVPDGFWFDWMEPVQQRGGTRYSTHIRSQIAACHTGFALGAGERAFDEITRLAATKKRMRDSATVADRGAFQRDAGRSYAQLSAARAYAADTLTELTRYQHDGDGLPDGFLERVHVMVTYATEVAIEVALFAYRYGGGTALRLDSPIQRTLRDLLAAQQHVYVADLNYDALGRHLTETSG
jgi:alkylation response protein AidB-like acyl-CoA dehydrogenase